ncbi:MAG: tetratricopeptide repeat protein, partial [Myxococcota bacterium]
DERLDPQRVADVQRKIRGRLFETAQEAEYIGRFEVIGPLGAGAMGAVHLAFDSDLDRKVALKVLKSSRGPLRDEYRQRMVREAQALARMNHPNVAGVYEVGSLDSGDVFIAMEYAEGETLTRWLSDEQRSWQEIVACFEQAARGLSAAHDRGLVHRDFKPDNVVIGAATDGAPPVVKVVDFGLARLVTETDPHGDQLTSREDLPGDSATSSLTRTGATVGTPVYMAPEQHLGESGPASDQFSFCAALYEALVGTRPFAGGSAAMLLIAKQAGDVRFPARAGGVPRWLQRVVVRGLAPAVDERFRSMQEVAEALTRRGYGRTRWALGLTVVGAVSLGGYVAGPSAPDCELDEIAGVWNDVTRRDLTSAFAATSIPFQGDAAQRSAGALDAFATAWANAAEEICTAPSDRAAVLCLDRRTAELRTVVNLLVKADEETVLRAHDLVRALGRPAQCVNRSDPSEAAGPDVDRGRLRAAAQTLAAIEAEAAAGQHRSAVARAEKLAATMNGLGPRFEAEVLLSLGRLQTRASDEDAALASLQSALERAELAGSDDLGARAWLRLATVELNRGAFAMAEERLAMAEAKAARASTSTTLLPDIELVRGRLRFDTGDLTGAISAYRRAVELLEADAGHDPRTIAYALSSLGPPLAEAGHFDEADATMQRAASTLSSVLGPDHPEVARQRLDRGILAVRRGRLQAASEIVEGVVERYVAVYGAMNAKVAIPEHALGSIALERGEFADAEFHFGRALEITRATRKPDHPDQARALIGVASSLLRQDKAAEAMPLLEEATSVATAAVGAGHILVAAAKVNLAEALLQLGRPAEATTNARAALTASLATLGPDHPELLFTRMVLGDALHRSGANDEAVEVLEAAVAMGAPEGSRVADRDRVQAILSRARGQAAGTVAPPDPHARSSDAGFGPHAADPEG